MARRAAPWRLTPPPRKWQTLGMQTAIACLTPSEIEAALPGLAALLADCVEGGAAVNFVWPFDAEQALAYWRRQLPGLLAGRAKLFVARDAGGGILGCVMLDADTPPNQPHRAEIKKLLVLRRARRLGLARALMLAAEDAARRLGRTLLILDTRDGDNGQKLYEAIGYVLFGRVPGYSLPVHGGEAETCAFYYKQL